MEIDEQPTSIHMLRRLVTAVFLKPLSAQWYRNLQWTVLVR